MTDDPSRRPADGSTSGCASESGPDAPDADGVGGDSDRPLRPDGGAYGAAPEPTADRLLPDRPSLRPGFLLGIAAFLGTYAVMYSLRAGELARAVGGLPFAISSSTPEITQVVGWLVYRAHFVPIEYSVSGAGSGSGVLALGDLPGAGQLVSVLEPGLLLLVPLFMLFIGGFYTAIECDVTTPRSGAIAGSTVVVGYLALVVVAIVAITWSISLSMFDLTFTASIGPETLRAVFVAGILYPLVGGALGGAAAGKVSE
jgi:hypothetical protein